jgi:glycosyltransferase involved in cell wall biosynthesis
MTAPGRPRVLLLGDSLRLGGTEGQFAEIAARLDRGRWEVDVACLSAEGPLRARVAAAGVEAWSCGRGSFKSPRFAAAVAALARRLRADRIAVLHAFDFYSDVLGVLAARLVRVPVVVASLRELGDIRGAAERLAYGVALRLATDVVVNSDAVAARVARVPWLRRARIRLVRNGVDVERFAPAAAAGVGGRAVVGTLANLRPEKGLADLVQAAGIVRERGGDTVFELWGAGPGCVPLEALIDRLGLGETVRLCGATAAPEQALRRFAVFVLPSLSEACSNALLEAMATGLPVVATAVGGTPAVVEEHATGLLVPPGDPAALAKAIERLVEDAEFAGRLGAAGRRRAETVFGMARMVGDVERVWAEAIARRGRR